MTTSLKPRTGAALLVAVLVMLVLDCIVIGTVHIAILERRLADNMQTATRLRLAAEAGARTSIGRWTADADSMAAADPPRLLFATASPDDLRIAVSVRRASADAFMVMSEARRPAPAIGRATAVLLVTPPPLTPGIETSSAALAVAGPTTLGNQAVVTANSYTGCGPAGDAVHLSSLSDLRASGGARIDGAVRLITPSWDVAGSSSRLFALADSVRPGDFRLGSDYSGALLVRGNLVVAAGVRLNGFAVVGGDLIVEQGAVVEGAVHVAGSARVDGRVDRHACAADAAIADAALTEARPLRGRAWLPGF